MIPDDSEVPRYGNPSKGSLPKSLNTSKFHDPLTTAGPFSFMVVLEGDERNSLVSLSIDSPPPPASLRAHRRGAALCLTKKAKLTTNHRLARVSSATDVGSVPCS